MSVPPVASPDGGDHDGSTSDHQAGCGATSPHSPAADATKFGVVACVLFMAGGLYWTASVGLLTVSALTAYPGVVMAGMVVSLLIFRMASQTARSPVGEAAQEIPGKISRVGAVHTYDAVTGLPMRRLFLSLVNQALMRVHKEGRQLAILVIDLTHFTPETDAYAQLNRNLMYRVQAARVKSALRTTDVVARLTEQRFAVLLERVTTQEDVLTIARNMQRTIAHPVTLDHHELLLSSRIGISLSGKDGLDAQGLIAAAVQALDGMQGEGSRVSGMNGAPDAPVADSRSTIAA